MKNSKRPFKYTLHSIANLAYLLSWPSVGSLPLTSGYPASSLCHTFQKSRLYSWSPPPCWSAPRIASLLCPSTCSGSGRAAVYLPDQDPLMESTPAQEADSSLHKLRRWELNQTQAFTLVPFHGMWKCWFPSCSSSLAKRGVKPGHTLCRSSLCPLPCTGLCVLHWGSCGLLSK